MTKEQFDKLKPGDTVLCKLMGDTRYKPYRVLEVSNYTAKLKDEATGVMVYKPYFSLHATTQN